MTHLQGHTHVSSAVPAHAYSFMSPRIARGVRLIKLGCLSIVWCFHPQVVQHWQSTHVHHAVELVHPFAASNFSTVGSVQQDLSNGTLICMSRVHSLCHKSA